MLSSLVGRIADSGTTQDLKEATVEAERLFKQLLQQGAKLSVFQDCDQIKMRGSLNQWDDLVKFVQRKSQVGIDCIEICPVESASRSSWMVYFACFVPTGSPVGKAMVELLPITVQLDL